MTDTSSSKYKYDAVAEDIRKAIPVSSWDDGSLAPLFVRLAWHASGTYDAKSGTGGSNGATMRFPPECTDPANNGLEYARLFLEPIKAKHAWISYADLWTLAGVVAVEHMGGPKVPWCPGRVDVDVDVNAVATQQQQQQQQQCVPPNGRLPQAELGAEHIRSVFYRMGFNDAEIVALLGAHSVGRCHPDRSGYTGAWSYTPTRFGTMFYKMLLNTEWSLNEVTAANGTKLKQFDSQDKKLMMLPADMALKEDVEFRKHVERYARDRNAFMQDFAAAFGKLLALGVPNNSPSSCPARM